MSAKSSKKFGILSTVEGQENSTSLLNGSQQSDSNVMTNSQTDQMNATSSAMSDTDQSNYQSTTTSTQQSDSTAMTNNQTDQMNQQNEQLNATSSAMSNTNKSNYQNTTTNNTAPYMSDTTQNNSAFQQYAAQQQPTQAKASQATSANSQANSTNSQATKPATSGNSKQGNTQTVVALFNSIKTAENAVNQLRNQGFNQEEINIISKKDNQSSGQYDDDVTDGTVTGGAIGGLGGLLMGAGALAIPGIGPIVAAGPIAAALGGAVAGGIAGGLVDYGIPAEEGKRYEENIAQGDILAVIRASKAKSQQISQILMNAGATATKVH